MTLNYRIVRYADASGFGLHSVDNDKISPEPCTFTGEDRGDIQRALQRAYTDAITTAVVDEVRKDGVSNG